MDDIGEKFQKSTKYHLLHRLGGPLDWGQKPDEYKNYPDKPFVELEKPHHAGGPGLWDVVRLRRSERAFVAKPVALKQLSTLLWAGQGITKRETGFEFRAAPSAGALYPIETYLAVFNVENLEPGLYHLNVQKFGLERLKAGDFRMPVAQAALRQEMCLRAGVVLIWSAVFERSVWKYKQRGYRYIYLDAGHIAHAVALASVALGLGSCQIAALFDNEFNGLLGLDGEKESTIYLTAVGQIN